MRNSLASGEMGFQRDCKWDCGHASGSSTHPGSRHLMPQLHNTISRSKQDEGILNTILLLRDEIFPLLTQRLWPASEIPEFGLFEMAESRRHHLYISTVHRGHGNVSEIVVSTPNLIRACSCFSVLLKFDIAGVLCLFIRQQDLPCPFSSGI